MSSLFKYIGFLFFLFPFFSFGQNTIRGAVLDYGDGSRVDGASIINLRSNQAFESNGLGLFNLIGRVGDTIRVSKLGYNEQNIVIASLDDIIVRLKGITELRVVDIYVKSKEQEMNDVMKDYRKQGSYYNGKPPALAYVFSPLSALHEAFGKTGKRVRRFHEYMNYEQDELIVDRKFNKTLVASLTDLKDADLTNFVSIYRPSFETVRYWNDYDAQAYIKKAMAQFEKNGRPAAPTLPKVYIPELSKQR